MVARVSRGLVGPEWKLSAQRNAFAQDARLKRLRAQREQERHAKARDMRRFEMLQKAFQGTLIGLKGRVSISALLSIRHFCLAGVPPRVGPALSEVSCILSNDPPKNHCQTRHPSFKTSPISTPAAGSLGAAVPVSRACMACLVRAYKPS